MGQIEHYLITISLTDDYHMHAYLVTNDRRDLERVTNRMIDKADELGFRVLVPIIMSTRLSDGSGAENIVRSLVSRKSKEAKRLMEKTTDFHLTMWAMPEEDPDNAKLMKLH